MDNGRPQHISPQQWQHIWQERGWINREVKIEDQDIVDDRGEEAYQRCFAEAIKKNRVPNPSYFVNSPSAQEYIRNRDKRLFPGSFQDPNARGPNPNFQASIRSSDDPEEQQDPTSPASSRELDPSSPMAEKPNGHYQPVQHTASEKVWPKNRETNGPLEPQVGPVGPPRMLR